MEKHLSYFDLSVVGEKAIDIGYFLQKIKNNGYSGVALDFEITDPKSNVSILRCVDLCKEKC
jgi:hypothetical protein